MKKKIFAIILLVLIVTFTNYNIDVSAVDSKLLTAVVVTSDGEKWGYIDETGAFVIKPAYDYVKDFNDNGIAIVANGEYNYEPCDVYFINKSGKIVVGPFFSNIPEFINGMATLNIAGKGSVMVDETGKVILESKYYLKEYSEELVSFSNNKLYGFMDLKGKVIIPAKYQSVERFKDGKCIVEVSAGKYSVIDKKGTVLKALKYYNEYTTSEELTPYMEDKTYKSGYKLQDGTVALAPQYSDAEPFRDGYAIVSIDGGDYGQLYGLIDSKGQYSINPEYSGITYLGQDLYAVSNNFKAISYHEYAPKALISKKGQLLTDYKYYRISEFAGDYAAASDNTSTFFIDKKGNIVDKFPRLKGIGEMRFSGNIIKAELDGGLTYLKANGEIIWQKNETIPLSNNIDVKRIKYRRDSLTYIEYPEVAGIENKTTQETINTKLKNYFLKGFENTPKENDEDFYEDNTVSFSALKNKDLLIIEKSGYWYPIGAAHGQPSKDYLYIDTKTGTFYELKDLFKTNSKYTEKLTAIVNSQMKLSARIGAISGAFGYNENSVKISEKQYFILGKDSIKIYYYPYEIAAYAAGFPEFEIPYGQITSIIDTKGAFWNSFDKKIVNQKINDISDIRDSKIKSIESLISSYEKNMVEAINSNSFSKVEACLLNGSSLYNSQKKLVQSLNKQKINEKLTKFEIYAVDYDYDKDEYRVYVQEEVAIKYSGKDFVNKKFAWCYTVNDDKNGNYKLTNIQKW